LASEVLLAIERDAPDVLCITALPPGGLNHIRYLCKRVHQQFPQLPIWILRAAAGPDPQRVVQELTSDGAQQVATSFTAATAQLAQFVAPAPRTMGRAAGAST